MHCNRGLMAEPPTAGGAVGEKFWLFSNQNCAVIRDNFCENLIAKRLFTKGKIKGPFYAAVHFSSCLLRP